MTPPGMRDRTVYRRARSQGFTGLGLIGGGVAVLATYAVIELLSSRPFSGPNISSGMVGVLGWC